MKRSVVARRDAVCDNGCQCWAQGGEDYPLGRGAIDDHWHKHEPRPRVGKGKKENQGIVDSHFVKRY
jgi:hypothetical protein